MNNAKYVQWISVFEYVRKLLKRRESNAFGYCGAFGIWEAIRIKLSPSLFAQLIVGFRFAITITHQSQRRYCPQNTTHQLPNPLYPTYKCIIIAHRLITKITVQTDPVSRLNRTNPSSKIEIPSTLPFPAKSICHPSFNNKNLANYICAFF